MKKKIINKIISIIFTKEKMYSKLSHTFFMKKIYEFINYCIVELKCFKLVCDKNKQTEANIFNFLFFIGFRYNLVSNDEIAIINQRNLLNNLDFLFNFDSVNKPVIEQSVTEIFI